MSKRKQGRPPKWEAFTRELDKVLYQDHPVGISIAWSDKQVWEEVNDRLPEEDRISLSSFEKYKAGNIQDESIESMFVTAYKKALRIQSNNVLKNLAEDSPGAWQKWAWIMERKFDEWNLRSRVVDESPDVSRLVFRVVKGASESEE
jgi:hypothetical protein